MVTNVFSVVRDRIDTYQTDNTSDDVLQILRNSLVETGFDVEAGKTKANKLFRPVFFGENGKPERQYEIDAYHPGEKIALEVEAGRSVLGNAIYRDIVQMSLMVDAKYAVIAVPLVYRYNSSGKILDSKPYQNCRSILDAIYSGRRLVLPFEGLLLIGY
ncbi:MAG: hypothetical protein ACOX87_05755 [Chloroflexota bacterium]|jgi:hypothetical protein